MKKPGRPERRALAIAQTALTSKGRASTDGARTRQREQAPTSSWAGEQHVPQPVEAGFGEFALKVFSSLHSEELLVVGADCSHGDG